MTRTDIHRPSVLDPADYSNVGDFDAHHEEGYCYLDPDYSDKDYSGVYSGNGYGKCDHCGNSIRYGAIFYHAPTDTLVSVGLRCAATLGLSSITEKEIRAKGIAAARRRAVEEWAAQSPDNAAVLAYFEQIERDEHTYYDAMEAWNEQDGTRATMPKPVRFYNEFLSDTSRKLRRYGSLSEKQVAGILKCRDREVEFMARRAVEAAKLAEAGPLVEGRREITGMITSAKFTEDRGYGSVPKMLITEDNGNKVWLTIPDHAFDGKDGIRNLHTFKGERVTVTATVTRSNDDEHFGFGKRPVKCTIEETITDENGKD